MDNLGWGLQMTVVGMGLVFALLAVLWGLLSLALRFDRESAPANAADAPAAAEAMAAAAAPAGDAPDADGLDPDVVAAICVATLTHKALLRRTAAPVMRSYWPGSLLFASRWVASGRVRQARNWRPKGR